MQEITRIKPITLAKIFSLFGMLFGILYGIQMGMASTTNPLTFEEATTYVMQDPTLAVPAYLIAFGWWSIIIAPIFLGIAYFVSGMVLAWLFNMFVKLAGGVKIEITETKKKK